MICRYCLFPLLAKLTESLIGNVPVQLGEAECAHCKASYHIEVTVARLPQIGLKRLEEIKNVPR